MVSNVNAIPDDPPWPERVEVVAPEAIALLTDLRDLLLRYRKRNQRQRRRRAARPML